jgi:hypothetical protein
VKNCYKREFLAHRAYGGDHGRVIETQTLNAQRFGFLGVDLWFERSKIE